MSLQFESFHQKMRAALESGRAGKKDAPFFKRGENVAVKAGQLGLIQEFPESGADDEIESVRLRIGFAPQGIPFDPLGRSDGKISQMIAGGFQNPRVQIHAYIVEATPKSRLALNKLGDIPRDAARDGKDPDLPLSPGTDLPESLLGLEISPAHRPAGREVKQPSIQPPPEPTLS